MSTRIAWVDVNRCIGCGACVEACRVGAIALAGDPARAHVEGGACTGCGSCLDVCREDAVSFVIQGDLIPVPEHPTLAVHRSSSLIEATSTAFAIAGTGLLVRTVEILARAVNRWLIRALSSVGPSGRAVSRIGDGTDRGRRSRYRRRGKLNGGRR